MTYTRCLFILKYQTFNFIHFIICLNIQCKSVYFIKVQVELSRFNNLYYTKEIYKHYDNKLKGVRDINNKIYTTYVVLILHINLYYTLIEEVLLTCLYNKKNTIVSCILYIH